MEQDARNKRLDMQAKPTIMVVDDTENVRRSFAMTLELYGYRAVVAVSGEDALEQLEREDISLTVMDVVMPGVGGIEASRRIKARDKNHPVILMSGYEQGYLEENGLPEGIRTFLRKPVDTDRLLREVEKELTVS